jgi:hypothetical protein
VQSKESNGTKDCGEDPKAIDVAKHVVVPENPPLEKNKKPIEGLSNADCEGCLVASAT